MHLNTALEGLRALRSQFLIISNYNYFSCSAICASNVKDYEIVEKYVEGVEAFVTLTCPKNTIALGITTSAFQTALSSNNYLFIPTVVLSIVAL